jgi:hypothetical protein
MVGTKRTEVFEGVVNLVPEIVSSDTDVAPWDGRYLGEQTVLDVDALFCSWPVKARIGEHQDPWGAPQQSRTIDWRNEAPIHAITRGGAAAPVAANRKRRGAA